MRSKSSSRPCRSPVSKVKTQRRRNWNNISGSTGCLIFLNGIKTWQLIAPPQPPNKQCVFFVWVTSILEFNEMRLCRRRQSGMRSQVPNQCANKQDLLSWNAAIKVQTTVFKNTFTNISDHLSGKQVFFFFFLTVLWNEAAAAARQQIVEWTNWGLGHPPHIVISLA